ncbi:hypothetical protein U9M48_016234 [Paspalum notatum var. saurae]|uniref:Uncharacterized protein n=1 Tax=Paspalum notatum var. saurae TaxID=547442 RepID=A0AAQ3WMC6_PASNO
MAAAADYPDDAEFDEYNPHPYRGGFDIAATYGSPLPPSPATCYPVAYPAAVPAPTAPQPRSPLPQPTPTPAPAPPPPPPPPAEPHYWPKPYHYGDAQPYQPMYATPEVFRGWPFLPGAHCHRSTACGRHDYWRQCMRGLDYLFGHSDGYGERQIGVDCLGVPVYANRKGAVQDAVVVEVAAPATGTVHWHHDDAPAAHEHHHSNDSNRLSWYGDAQEETHTYAQPTYTSYSYEQSYDLHGVSDETTWFPNQNYQDVYNDEESQYQESLSCHQGSEISSQPIFSYNQHFGEQPLHIHVEPPETVSSHKLEYYENFSTYDYQNDVNSLENSRQSYEIQPYVHMPYDQAEPYKPSWSLNSGYYQACTEGITPEYDNNALASGECWDMSSLFMSPFYPQETQTYEQSHGDWNV